MKKKGVSIVALWERASKANKRTSTSTPNPPDVEVESSIIPPTIESNLQLALVQAHEPDDGHTEPESAAGSPTPIVEDDEANDEVQFEVDLEALESDPGKRIPISRYNVNDQDKVRRRYIELEGDTTSMSYVKNKLRNKMGDEYLNNCLVTFVEREFFDQVKDEDVMNLFQKGDRKVIL